MADDNSSERLTRIEARLEGIETELLKLTELVTDNLAETRRSRDEIRLLQSLTARVDRIERGA